MDERPAHLQIALNTLIALVLVSPGVSHASDIRVEGRLETLAYPESRRAVPDEPLERQVQGEIGAETEGVFRNGPAYHLEARAYVPPLPEDAFVDGQIELLVDAPPATLRIGLLQERWGRTAGSRLDMLTAENFVFGLARKLRPISQPGFIISRQLGGMFALKIAGLVGARHSPFPDLTARRSFRLPTRVRTDTGTLAHGALAARLSGFLGPIDWTVHGFAGEARDPTFVLLAEDGSPVVEAVYDDVRQLSLELETSVRDWRIWIEGFYRVDGRDSRGTRVDYGHVAAAAEYQYFAAFDGALDVIVELRALFDGRRDLVDQPFGNAVSLGVLTRGTRAQPFSAELTALVDTMTGGTGYRLAIEKQMNESPYLAIEFYLEGFGEGRHGGVLDVLERDESAALALNWEF